MTFFIAIWFYSICVMGDPITVRIPHTACKIGDTVNVPIQVSDLTNKGILSCEMTLTFDPRVKALKANTGSLIPQKWMLESNPTPGKIQIALAGPYEITGDGVLVWIPFLITCLTAVRDSIETDSILLHFSRFVFNEGSIPVDLYDGALIINPAKNAPDSILTSKEIPNQISPNPFTEITEIRYELPKEAYVNISIYNLFGQRVAILADEYQKAGYHTLRWDGMDRRGIKLSPGIYFCCLKTQDCLTAVRQVKNTRKIILLSTCR